MASQKQQSNPRPLDSMGHQIKMNLYSVINLQSFNGCHFIEPGLYSIHEPFISKLKLIGNN